MTLNREKNVLVSEGKEYPPTRYNAEIYVAWMRTEDQQKKEELEKRLSDVVLD